MTVVDDQKLPSCVRFARHLVATLKIFQLQVESRISNLPYQGGYIVCKVLLSSDKGDPTIAHLCNLQFCYNVAILIMELFFLINQDISPRGRHTVQDIELQSNVRAHAARVSHRRRRSQCVPQLIHPGTIAQSASALVAVRKKERAESEDQANTSQISELVAKSGFRKFGLLSLTVPKGFPVVPRSETRDICELFRFIIGRFLFSTDWSTDATFARPGYKVIFDVFNVRNTLNEDPYYYWTHEPFFLGIACDMRSLKEKSIDPNSTPGDSASVSNYMVKAVTALRTSLAEEPQVSDINLMSIMLLALCEVGNASWQFTQSFFIIRRLRPES